MKQDYSVGMMIDLQYPYGKGRYTGEIIKIDDETDEIIVKVRATEELFIMHWSDKYSTFIKKRLLGEIERKKLEVIKSNA